MLLVMFCSDFDDLVLAMYVPSVDIVGCDFVVWGVVVVGGYKVVGVDVVGGVSVCDDVVLCRCYP